MDEKTKKLGEKEWRQQKGLDGELDFQKFCNKNSIYFRKLDEDKSAREEYIMNSDGACPDFLCSKNEFQIFVEVKTHTLLTNEARNKNMVNVIESKKAAGLSGTTVFEVFDPHPELTPVYKRDLQDASRKFKNIKKLANFQEFSY